MEAQLAMALELRESVNQLAALTEDLESLRAAVAALPGDEGVLAGARVSALSRRLDELAGRIYDLRMSGGTARQDALRWPRRLYAKLTSLAGYIGGGDDAPTDRACQVYAGYQEEWTRLRTDFAAGLDGPIREVDEALSRAGRVTLTEAARTLRSR